MQNLKILNSKEKKRILKQLGEQFGYNEKLKLVFLQNKENELFVINREIEQFELEKLKITSLGMHFATIKKDGIELTIEGSQLIGNKAKKNILKISDLQFEFWLKGMDIKIETKLKGYVLVKNNEDFVGCGKINKEGSLWNTVPKSRRLVVVNN